MAQPWHFGDVLHPLVRHRALDERHAGARGALGQRRVGPAHEHAGKSGRGDDQRQRRIPADNRRGHVTVRFIDQRVRHHAPFGEAFAFARQRRLLAGAAFEIFEGETRHQLVRARAQVVDRLNPRDIAAGVIAPPRRPIELGDGRRSLERHAAQTTGIMPRPFPPGPSSRSNSPASIGDRSTSPRFPEGRFRREIEALRRPCQRAGQSRS